MAPHFLDNPTWHAAVTEQARYVTGTALAKRYTPEIGPLIALADHSDAALQDMAAIAAPGEHIFMFEAELPELDGWTIHFHDKLLQMVSTRALATHNDPDVVTLTTADVPEIVGLIERNPPGPFSERAMELGHFVGIRQHGKLVAMAGERFCFPGYHEVSTICTHPGYEGRGYAGRVVASLVHENWQNGITPYLHVRPDNQRAIRLYERLGFEARREMQIVAASRE